MRKQTNNDKHDNKLFLNGRGGGGHKTLQLSGDNLSHTKSLTLPE